MGKLGEEALKLTDDLLHGLSRLIPGELSNNELDILEFQANHAVSTIRSLRNMSSHFHKIPMEVLGLVFANLIEMETPKRFLPDIPAAGPQCSAIRCVSRVCKKWREAALAFPALWSTIYRGEGPPSLLKIDRSLDTPLKIFTHESAYPSGNYWPVWTPPGSPKPPLPGGSVRLLDALASQGHRIEQLHILEASSETLNTSTLMSTPLPALESLTLSVNSNSQPGAWGVGPFWQPDKVFDGVIPRLRQLTLQRCHTFPEQTFGGLTHLCLANQPSGHRFTLGRFLDILRASPELEELSMIDCAPDLDGVRHPKVFLGHLRVLCLGSWGTSTQISLFLENLVIPHPIEFFIWSARTETGATLQSIFPLYTTQGDGLKILRLTAYHSDQQYIGPRSIWRSEHQYGVISNRTTLQVDGRLEPPEFLFDAPTLLNLSSVQELWLGSPYRAEPTIDEWRSFFFSLPSLLTLVISRRSSHGIISCLTLPKDNLHGDLLCPDLEVLRIYNDRLLSVLRLAIFSEQRDRRGKRLKLVEVISDGTRRDDVNGEYQSADGWAQWTQPQAAKPWPDAVVADLMHLTEYVDKVDCERVVTNSEWDIVPQWPPRSFNWSNRISSLPWP